MPHATMESGLRLKITKWTGEAAQERHDEKGAAANENINSEI